MRARAITILALSVLAAETGWTDLFRIELDYMVDASHSHEPAPLVADALIQMFACEGHTLVIDVDDAIPHYAVIVDDTTGTDSFWAYADEDSAFGALRATYFDRDGLAGWHYGVIGHRYRTGGVVTNSSGRAELPGANFIVTLGNHLGGVGSPFRQASTIAHEFGHNLGLEHCGSMDCTSDSSGTSWVGPVVPTMPSVMSYFFQLNGVRQQLECFGLAPEQAELFKHLDYSRGYQCFLDENALDENRGNLMIPVDWDCSGAVGGVVAEDINVSRFGWCNTEFNLSVVGDYDEWANIEDVTWLARRPPARDVTCIAYSDWQSIVAGGVCPDPPLTVESCREGQMLFVRPSGLPSASGRCGDPIETVADAQAAASPATTNHLYLEAGTYDEGPLILSKPMKLFSSEGAVIR